jgi:hypothetical protein
MKQKVIRNALLPLLSLTLVAGCADKDRHKEVAEVAKQAAERQAQQNTEMARLNREVAEGTRRLVEADAATRKETTMVHRDIQAERTSLNDGFDKLEAERKQMAQQRRTESVLVPAIKTIGVAIMATAVVLFCLLLLVRFRSSDASDAELNELLIHDLVSEHPRLLSGRHNESAIETNPVTNDSEPPLLSAVEQVTEEATEQGETN